MEGQSWTSFRRRWFWILRSDGAQKRRSQRGLRLLEGKDGLGEGFDALDERVFGLHADDAVDLFAVLEEHQHGDGTDTELGGEVGAFVDIDLADFESAALVGGELLEDGGEHAARATPFGPEVDDDRAGGGFDLGLEVVGVESDEGFAGHGGVG